MPVDPYAVLQALVRAEAARSRRTDHRPPESEPAPASASAPAAGSAPEERARRRATSADLSGPA